MDPSGPFLGGSNELRLFYCLQPKVWLLQLLSNLYLKVSFSRNTRRGQIIWNVLEFNTICEQLICIAPARGTYKKKCGRGWDILALTLDLLDFKPVQLAQFNSTLSTLDFLNATPLENNPGDMVRVPFLKYWENCLLSAHKTDVLAMLWGHIVRTLIFPLRTAAPSSASLSTYRSMLYSLPPRRLKPKPLLSRSKSTE